MIQDLTGIHNEAFYDTSKPEGYSRRAADTTKLKKVTDGFIPTISLEEGLQEMIAWYENQKRII